MSPFSSATMYWVRSDIAGRIERAEYIDIFSRTASNGGGRIRPFQRYGCRTFQSFCAQKIRLRDRRSRGLSIARVAVLLHRGREVLRLQLLAAVPDLVAGEYVGQVPRVHQVVLVVHRVADEVAQLEGQRVDRGDGLIGDAGLAVARVVALPDVPVRAGDVGRPLHGPDGLVIRRLVVPHLQVAAARVRFVRFAGAAGAEPHVVGRVVRAGGAVVGPRPAGGQVARLDRADRLRHVSRGVVRVLADEDRGERRRAIVLPHARLLGDLHRRALAVHDRLALLGAPVIVLHDVLLRTTGHHPHTERIGDGARSAGRALASRRGAARASAPRRPTAAAAAARAAGDAVGHDAGDAEVVRAHGCGCRARRDLHLQIVRGAVRTGGFRAALRGGPGGAHGVREANLLAEAVVERGDVDEGSHVRRGGALREADAHRVATARTGERDGEALARTGVGHLGRVVAARRVQLHTDTAAPDRVVRGGIGVRRRAADAAALVGVGLVWRWRRAGHVAVAVHVKRALDLDRGVAIADPAARVHQVAGVSRAGRARSRAARAAAGAAAAAAARATTTAAATYTAAAAAGAVAPSAAVSGAVAASATSTVTGFRGA